MLAVRDYFYRFALEELVQTYGTLHLLRLRVPAVRKGWQRLRVGGGVAGGTVAAAEGGGVVGELADVEEDEADEEDGGEEDEEGVGEVGSEDWTRR